MLKKIGLGLLLASVATAASAVSTETCKVQYFLGFFPYEVCQPTSGPTPVSAPEIDPASAMAGLTLMGGILAVVGERRRKMIGA